jgi:phosphoadenosine phosphosulfate reductase
MDAKRSGLFRKNNVPQNTLHKQGFVVLCAPCTRAISEDEDIRAGRWW